MEALHTPEGSQEGISRIHDDFLPNDTLHVIGRALTQAHIESPSLLHEWNVSHVLTAEQEIELAKMIEAGVMASHVLEQRQDVAAIGLPDDSTSARELMLLTQEGSQAMFFLLRSNIGFVLKNIHQKRVHIERTTGIDLSNKIELEDFVLDVVYNFERGLGRAALKFDYKKGNKFSTYAKQWILLGISDAIAARQQLSISPQDASRDSTLRKAWYEAQETQPEERNHQQRELVHPTTDIKIGSIAMSRGLYLAIRESFTRQVASFDVMKEGIEQILQAAPNDTDLLTDSEGPILMSMRNKTQQVQGALQSLADNERRVIALMFGLDGAPGQWSLDEIAWHLHKTRKSVEGIYNRARLKLCAKLAYLYPELSES